MIAPVMAPRPPKPADSMMRQRFSPNQRSSSQLPPAAKPTAAPTANPETAPKSVPVRRRETLRRISSRATSGQATRTVSPCCRRTMPCSSDLKSGPMIGADGLFATVMRRTDPGYSVGGRCCPSTGPAAPMTRARTIRDTARMVLLPIVLLQRAVCVSSGRQADARGGPLRLGAPRAHQQRWFGQVSVLSRVEMAMVGWPIRRGQEELGRHRNLGARTTYCIRLARRHADIQICADL